MNKNITRAASCAAVSILACASALAQVDEKGKRATEPQACHYLKGSEIVGSKVSTYAADGAKSDKVIGEVKDIIVDTNGTSGHGSFAVLSDGELLTLGNDHIHGVACLKWDGVSRRFGLDSTLPSDAIADASMRTAREANAAPTRGAPGASRLLMFSAIKGMKVFPQGSKDSFGKVEDLWIDTGKGCTGYVVVSSGGVLGVGDTVRLIPWSVASIDRSADLKENHVNVRATKEALEAAPKLEGKTEPNDASVRAQACKNFGCEDPSMKTDVKTDLDRSKRMEDGKK